MEAVQELTIERACMRLIADYCRLWDARDIENWLLLYHDDIVFDTEGGRPVEGLGKLRASLTRRPPTGSPTRHVSANHVIEVQDTENATGTCAMLLYRAEAESAQPLTPEGISDFTWAFVKTEAGWRIKLRHARRQMSYKPA